MTISTPTPTVSTDPAYQFMPPMSAEDFERLKQSIATHGYVGAPVVLDEDGRILDGHHRARACAEVGVEYPKEVITDLTESEKWDYVWIVNVPRRHLTVSEKTALAREYYTRHPDAGVRQVARDTGISLGTSSNIRREVTGVQNERPPGDWEDDIPSENAADHRNMVWFELVIGYAAPSDRERVRNGTPYPRESERKEWQSGRQYLTSTTPTSTDEANALADELAERVKVELRDRTSTLLTLR